MKCQVCNRESKNGEAFYCLSWQYVNKAEYTKRKKDGRTLYINEVCPDCIEKHQGRPPLSLKDICEIRRRGITKEQYYKEHGYTDT